MSTLMVIIMSILALCVSGAFIMVVSVCVYIGMAIHAESRERKDKNCEWLISDGIYNTGCGNDFYDASESGNPATEWLTYCPYCGRVVKEK